MKYLFQRCIYRDVKSHSARKVWIEMNKTVLDKITQSSPSARKVWIEILIRLSQDESIKVTFCEEGVD